MENIEVLVRPRLNDYHGILMLQDKVDFAIPFLDEDIPLYVDPFLLWKSPSQMDNGLHDSIIQSFNHLGFLVNKGNYQGAADLLISLSECDAVGLNPQRQGREVVLVIKWLMMFCLYMRIFHNSRLLAFLILKKFNCLLVKWQKTELVILHVI